MKKNFLNLYPLRFKEILRNYGFGNRWIAQTFKKTSLPDNHRIAETWEVCDRPGESSLVINGFYAGQTLHNIITQNPTAILGTDIVQQNGERFPLLIKLLDASFTLGEQAHHNDALAARRGLPDPGKTEAWVMLRTRPDAEIRCGQRDDQITTDTLRAAILDGSTRDIMRPYTVQPGDSFLLYAGTMHYTPGGVLFYEIMQNSDVHISLRPPSGNLTAAERQARLDETLEGVHLEPGFDCRTAPVRLNVEDNKRSFLLACNYFALERLDLHHPYLLNCNGKHFIVLTQIEDSCLVHAGSFKELLNSGQSCLLPAAIGAVTLQPMTTCALLVGYVPDLIRDVITPLRQAAVPDEVITRLGGRTRLNHLLALM